MTRAEELIRSTTTAIAATVGDVPSLRLTRAEDDPVPAEPRARRARITGHWLARPPRWLAPVAAAAAVVALAVSLVIIKGLANGPAVPPAAPVPASVVPAYYVALSSQPGWYAYAPLPGKTFLPPNTLVVRDTFTGRTVSTIAPPSGRTFMGVSGTADDRTFVVDVASNPPSPGGDPRSSAGKNLLNDRTGRRYWELLRISPGSSPGYRLTPLPIPATVAGTDVRGFTLAPDGGELAVVLQPGAAANSQAPVLLRLYSIATGAVLRTWTTTDSDNVFGGSGYSGPDANHLVAWAGGTRFLAFGRNQPEEVSGSSTVLVPPSAHIMLLDTARPGGDLLADSHPAVALNLPHATNPALRCGIQTLGDVLISGNGRFLACGGAKAARAPAPAQGDCTTGTARNQVAFLDYRLATGGLGKTIASRLTRCYGAVVSIQPVWVNDSGSTVIGYVNLGESDPLAIDIAAGGRFGLFSHGTFTPLPVPPDFARAGAAAFAW